MRKQKGKTEELRELKCGNGAGILIPWHIKYFERERVVTPKGFIKRTFCPICMTYWEEKYKKVKGAK